MTTTLSKSDFKTASECPVKLYYKKKRYVSATDDDPFLRLLADGGYMVEKIAKLLYDDGIEMEYVGSSEAAAAKTMKALEAKEATLFEATLLSGVKLARVDILVKRGNSLDLIEVKSASFDSRKAGALRADGIGVINAGPKGGGLTEWQPYLEDVAFQTLVLRELFPTAAVRSFLLMPDIGKSTHIDVIHERFTMHREATDTGGFVRVRVDFDGDVEALRRDHFLTCVDVSDHVASMLDSVKARAAEFADLLTPEPRPYAPPPLAISCGACEYRAAAASGRSGFAECWGAERAGDPHIVDLYKAGVGKLKDRINQLIVDGRHGLLDIDEGLLVDAKGKVGANNRRQLVQLRHTRTNREWVSDQLAALLATQRAPLHFIDFEASRLAVPYHAGMRPYELAAFQWSCHTLEAPDAAPTHAEWINTTAPFPNFEFARSLRQAVGDEGSVFMWHHFEATTVRNIVSQMAERREHDPALATWLATLADRFVDLNKICLEHYFHPRMGKSTSIKDVLDAVWAEDPRARAEFPTYAASSTSPYRTLAPLVIDGEAVVVQEGTGAVEAYQAMMYGPQKRDPVARAQYRKLLLQYCELDTAAMVVIWRHWMRAAPAGA